MGRTHLNLDDGCIKAPPPEPSKGPIASILIMLFAASMVYVFAVVQRMSPPVVAMDIMRSLQITPESMSLLFVGTTICYGLMQPVAGFWADRFGPRRCLLGSVAIMTIGSLVFSISQSMPLSLLSRLCIGAAAGMALLPCLKLAGQWLPARQFGLATSTIIATGALASFIVGRPLAQFSYNFGWRWSFAAMAIAGLALGILIAFLVKDGGPDVVKATPEDEIKTDILKPPKISFMHSMYLVVRQPEFWLLAVLYSGMDMIYGAFMGLWAGPYLTEVYGIDKVMVGNMISISAISLLFGPPLMVLWSSIWRSYGKVLFCITLINVVIVTFLMISPGMGTAGLYVLCIVAPVGTQIGALIFVMSRDMFPEHLAATSMGILNLVCVSGGAIMQQLIGYILTKNGAGPDGASGAELYRQAFTPVLICMIFSVFLAVWQIRKERVGPMMRP